MSNLKKYRVLKSFQKDEIIVTIKERNMPPDWFEEIKEPEVLNTYFYINDKLEIVGESYPNKHDCYDSNCGVVCNDKKWGADARIKAGNCFEKRETAERALCAFKVALETFKNYELGRIK